MPGKRRWVFDKLCACFTLPSSGSNATSKHDNHPMSWFLVPDKGSIWKTKELYIRINYPRRKI
jgi:hypothetical protein